MTTCAPVQPVDLSDEWFADVSDKDIARAVGAELRLVRESRGWSRATLVEKLGSKIGDRTLLSYEHGARQMTVCRLAEICAALGVSISGLMQDAMQRARLHLNHVPLRVDVRMVINHSNDRFRPMVQWARNKLNANPQGVIELVPAAVLELATFIGCGHKQLANYLAQFMPDREVAMSS